jgi:hypothetical protein
MNILHGIKITIHVVQHMHYSRMELLGRMILPMYIPCKLVNYLHIEPGIGPKRKVRLLHPCTYYMKFSMIPRVRQSSVIFVSLNRLECISIQDCA